MSKIKELAANWSDPSWWPSAVRKFLYHRLVWSHYELKKRNGVAVMDEDWDTLVILDACRYDMFERTNSIEGSLEYRYSLGSSTPDFLRENFTDGRFHDTVYVTANPMYRHGDFLDYDIPRRFHATIDVWASDWDERLGTTKPASVKDAALDAIDEYPEKRHIVHFMQPHRPFIGDIGGAIDGQRGVVTRDEIIGSATARGGERVWKLVDMEKVSVKQAWQAYRENLELVLPHAKKVVKCHDGKRVVTSDHGNLVREPVGTFTTPRSGHPSRTWVEELVKVPWLVLDDGTRRDVVPEDPESDRNTRGMEEVEDRLQDLGYAE